MVAAAHHRLCLLYLTIYHAVQSQEVCPPPTIISSSLQPNSVSVAFDDSIDYDAKVFQINASLPAISNNVTSIASPCRQLVVWLGDINYGDRKLPTGSGAVCAHASPGHLALDYLYTETFAYSCCHLKNKNCTTSMCTFYCPIPPPNLVGPDSLDEEIGGWDNYIYATNQDHRGTWTMNPSVSFTYFRDDQPFSVFKIFLGIICGFPVIFGVVSLTTGKLHETASTTPGTSFAVHLLSTMLILFVLLYLLVLSMNVNTTEEEAFAATMGTSASSSHDRRKLTEFGLIYAIITVTYSPLIMYTPKPQVQTIHIGKGTLAKTCGRGTCESITRLIKSKYVRNFCACIYFLGIVLQGISVYALYNALREFLATDIETSITVIIIYLVLVLVYSVAFITAIYEMRPILRVDRQRGVVTKAYPKTITQLRKKALADPRKVGVGGGGGGGGPRNANKGQLYFFNEVNRDFSNISRMKVAKVLADDALKVDEGCVVVLKVHKSNKATNDVYIWKMGHINDENEIELTKATGGSGGSGEGDGSNDEEDDVALKDTEEGTAKRFPLLLKYGKEDGASVSMSAAKQILHFLYNCIFGSCLNCFRSNIALGTCKNNVVYTDQKLTNTNAEQVEYKEDANAAQPVRGTMAYLNKFTNFNAHSLNGTLYVMKRYNDTSFRFMEIGCMEKGVVVQRRNIILVWIGFLFHFEDGDALDPSIDWQPNLVESMRAQGWVNFDHCGRCCRGENCGKWHLLLMGALSVTWTSIIIGQLANINTYVSYIGTLTCIIGIVELLLVICLSIAGYIVATDVDEDDKVKGYEYRKLIEDAGALRNKQEDDDLQEMFDDVKDNLKNDVQDVIDLYDGNEVDADIDNTMQELSPVKPKLMRAENETEERHAIKMREVPHNVQQIQEVQHAPLDSAPAVQLSTVQSRGTPAVQLSTVQSSTVQSRGSKLNKFEFKISVNNKKTSLDGSSTIKGDNMVALKDLKVVPMEGCKGCNVLLTDFQFNLHSDSRESHIVHTITFECVDTTTINNVAIGMIECDSYGSLGDSTPAVSIGNTNGGFNSFGVHSDDGSCIVGRKDKEDGWQNIPERKHLIWWRGVWEEESEDKEFKQGPTAQYIKDETTEEARKIFKRFDRDKNNSIEKKELSNLSIALGNPLSPAEVQDLLVSLDTNNSNTIAWDEFIPFWLDHRGVNKEEYTKSKFTVSIGFDRNKQEFFVTCDGKDKEYLPEVLSQNGGLLEEWWSNPSSTVFPVVSFDYSDDVEEKIKEEDDFITIWAERQPL